ncbi:gas1-like protein [Grosmannia clavigera kw1407]|uniref:Gas1-like protein n=1 Tax=Grosmannia clavigera (strain kw1407 / UAMH 11150) TaxID=655863 RepID=F0XBH0_GROCL|nr:gas1-like protein [Grosmannia clavigera kw1407]EFX04911.1 gas1-like protein [Grosmannia clavigera kw1407]
MVFARSIFTFTVLAAVPLAYGQGVIQSAQGAKGSPASLGLQVKTGGTDANIINSKEIVSNVVNECGRTLLGGNIDIGENTEEQLANNTVTSVTKGSTVTVKIAKGSASGAGPYTCDLDLTSNGNGATGQTNLTVAETDSNGSISLAVTMPSDMACIGASTGNVCTVRCFNSAAAGPFGGCFAVKQTDTTAKANTPDNIETEQTAAGIAAQVAVNKADLASALAANANAGASEAEQGLAAVKALADDSTATADSAAATSTAKATKTKGSGAKATNAAKGNGNGFKGFGGFGGNGANGFGANGANGAKAAAGNGFRGFGNAKRNMRWGKRYVVPAVEATEDN